LKHDLYDSGLIVGKVDYVLQCILCGTIQLASVTKCYNWKKTYSFSSSSLSITEEDTSCANDGLVDFVRIVAAFDVEVGVLA